VKKKDPAVCKAEHVDTEEEMLVQKVRKEDLFTKVGDRLWPFDPVNICKEDEYWVRLANLRPCNRSRRRREEETCSTNPE
jgi:hypothetical protein